jgi:Ca2+-transporting ATPase
MMKNSRSSPHHAFADQNPGATTPAGLSEAEAARRLVFHGPNIMGKRRTRDIGQILRATLHEPMFLLLIAASGLYLVLGSLGEGLFLLASAMASIALVVVQESRSERALAALRNLAEPFAIVVRDGQERRIPARELVPGDLLLVGEGERLPADAALLSGDALTVDESALTGESVPVIKQPLAEASAETAEPEPGGDGTPYLFAGTLTVRGQAAATVLRTGSATWLGRIGRSLAGIESEPTLLQQRTRSLIAKLGVLAISFCVLVMIAYGTLRADWVGGALAGLTLAMALLPEEFPMVITIFLAFGSRRLAQNRALVRRAAVVETLGAATLLCVDKTGTLTANQMTVTTAWREGRTILFDSERPDHEATEGLLRVAALASAVRPVDPMDPAVRALAGADIGGRMLLRTYPLQPERLAFIQLWAEPDGGDLMAAKGAPEAILRLCRSDATARAEIEAAVASLANRGLRVLGVASRRQNHDGPQDPEALPFAFEGLIGFIDPVREDAPGALAEARRAGIEVAMITGDYPATALAIARQAGIEIRGGVLTGKQVADLDAVRLRERIRDVRVFARIMPVQKLALVEAFKADGHIVAMTGDGINDAPALESAQIGIAMGRRGTDVAREAADIVLLDDSFATIVGGVRLGRRISANLRNALTYITAIHIPIAGLALLPILFGLPPILFPMHVVLLELVLDPICSLAFEGEPGDPRVMEKPPRPAGEALFGARQLAFGSLQGAIVLMAVFGLYLVVLDLEMTEPAARALAFTALMLSNLALAFAISAEPGTPFFDPRRLVFWVIGGAAALAVAAVIYVPLLARIFRVIPPDGAALAASAAVAVVAGGWFSVFKRLRGAAHAG